MSDEPVNPTTSISAWWILLLVPVALPIGWLVGGMPGPKPRPPKAWVATTTATPDDRSRRTASTSSPSNDAPLWSADPAPAQPPTEDAKPAVVSQWTDLQSAMSESQRNGKPVLIDFNAEWCGPCRAMKQELFDDGARGEVVKTAVIPVSIVDRRREEGQNPPEIENLQQRFHVTAFPTLVVFSPETGKIERTQGFGSAEATQAWITEAAKSVR
jgi:thiol-disulfide isomerase/thioredoxin